MCPPYPRSYKADIQTKHCPAHAAQCHTIAGVGGWNEPGAWWRRRHARRGGRARGGRARPVLARFSRRAFRLWISRNGFGTARYSKIYTGFFGGFGFGFSSREGVNSRVQVVFSLFAGLAKNCGPTRRWFRVRAVDGFLRAAFAGFDGFLRAAS